VDKRVKVGTIEELMREPDPWIQEYFGGPRGRAAAGSAQRAAVEAGHPGAPERGA
jgi:phospholipid/cholesterol/gamma-HCH transport system ATP-binding protein